MACGLTALNSASGCPDNTGGIQYSYGCKKTDITALTITSGQISGFTMASTGLWKKLEYDKNETSRFSQVGERVNDFGPIFYNQESFMHFGGISHSLKSWGDDAAECCELVFIHVLTNGNKVVQGIEIDTSMTGNISGTKLQPTKLTPSQESGTAAEVARLEALIKGRAKQLAPFTTLSSSAIEAL